MLDFFAIQCHYFQPPILAGLFSYFFRDYPNFQGISGTFSRVSTVSWVFKGFQGLLATLFDVSSLISLARHLASINKKQSSYLADSGCCCVDRDRWVSANPLLKKENL